MEIENEVTISTHNGSQVSRQHNLRNPKVIVKEDHIDPNGHFEVWRDEDPKSAYFSQCFVAEFFLKSKKNVHAAITLSKIQKRKSSKNNNIWGK